MATPSGSPSPSTPSARSRQRAPAAKERGPEGPRGDREILAWTASPRGIGGIAVRDLVPLAVERRFGRLEAPRPIEWSADNGSCVTARETVAFAHGLGLVPCLTPVRSPGSKRIAEAFVKTLERDHVGLNARPNAVTVMAALDTRFEDCNEMHPHRALGMRSPRRFIRAHQPATCPVRWEQLQVHGW